MLAPYSDTQRGIHVGSSVALLRRTEGDRWDGALRVFVSPEVDRAFKEATQFLNTGLFHAGETTFEILNMPGNTGSAIAWMLRVLPVGGRPVDVWTEDLYLDPRRFTGPWPGEASLARWRHLYPHLPDVPAPAVTPAGLHVGSSASLLGRTNASVWEGCPLVPYDPDAQQRFVGSGVLYQGTAAHEFVVLRPGVLCVRALPRRGGADHTWAEDLYLDAKRLTLPVPGDEPLTRWLDRYRHSSRMGGDPNRWRMGQTRRP